MLKQTDYSSPDGHVYLKCKSCKQEFYIVSAAVFSKTINFCPYCGDYAHKMDKLRYRNTEEKED